MQGLSHRIIRDSSSLPFRCAYSPRNKNFAAGLNASWYQQSTNGNRITLRSIPLQSPDCTNRLRSRTLSFHSSSVMLTRQKAALQSAIRLHLAGLKGKRNTPLDKSRAQQRHLFTALASGVLHPQAERRFAKRIEPRLARRGKAVMCAQKRTFKPVSNDDERSQASVGSTSTGNATTPRRPSSPWTPIIPASPPNSNSQGEEGALGGSWCCWPTLQQLHLVLVKDTGRHDKSDCVQ